MQASSPTQESIDRANQLYWGSDKSVNQIADELDLSKGALYGMIEPQPSGMGCPLCGDQVAYPNRTAKERGLLDCPTCDWDGGPDETTEWAPEPPPAPVGVEAADEEYGRLPEPLPPPPYIRPSANTVMGGALIGAAVGLALVMWARKR